MAEVRSNGRIVNFQGRREYRVRKRAGRIQRRNANGLIPPLPVLNSANSYPLLRYFMLCQNLQTD